VHVVEENDRAGLAVSQDDGFPNQILLGSMQSLRMFKARLSLVLEALMHVRMAKGDEVFQCANDGFNADQPFGLALTATPSRTAALRMVSGGRFIAHPSQPERQP